MLYFFMLCLYDNIHKYIYIYIYDQGYNILNKDNLLFIIYYYLLFIIIYYLLFILFIYFIEYIKSDLSNQPSIKFFKWNSYGLLSALILFSMLI